MKMPLMMHFGPRKAVSVKILLPSNKSCLQRAFPWVIKESPLALLLQKHVNDLPDHAEYPWCFVLPAGGWRHKYYYIGAFTFQADHAGKHSVSALYSRMSYQQLCREFMTRQSIAFWLMRILAGTAMDSLETRAIKSVHYWVKTLVRSYSPLEILREKQTRFDFQSAFLLSECCDFDVFTEHDNGVEFMPWANWPECIQTGNKLWIWRQNKFARITSSQRISLAGNKLNDMPGELRN